MTKEETRNILTLLKVNYPQSYNNMTAPQKQAMLELWSKAFAKVPYHNVLQAVETIIVTDTREFAPNVGQVMNMVIGQNTEDSQLEAEKAWDEVKRLVKEHGCDYINEFYDQLPETTRRTISKDGIRAIGMNGPEDNERFTKPQFIKTYKAIKEASERTLIETGHIDQLIAEHVQKALKQGNYKQIGENNV